MKQFTVSGLVLHPDRKVLLVDHLKLNSWVYPGGHVKWYETPDQTARREVLEETRIRVRLLTPRHRHSTLPNFRKDIILHTPYMVLSEEIRFPPEPMHYHIDLIYLCAVSPRSARVKPRHNSEARAARFFGSHEIEKLHIRPDIRNLLRLVFQDKAVWMQIAAN